MSEFRQEEQQKNKVTRAPSDVLQKKEEQLEKEVANMKAKQQAVLREEKQTNEKSQVFVQRHHVAMLDGANKMVTQEDLALQQEILFSSEELFLNIDRIYQTNKPEENKKDTSMEETGTKNNARNMVGKSIEMLEINDPDSTNDESSTDTIHETELSLDNTTPGSTVRRPAETHINENNFSHD